jgi:hypothetical protein
MEEKTLLEYWYILYSRKRTILLITLAEVNPAALYQRRSTPSGRWK